ncbi:hypothetical protein [Micromonospora echinofusca]|uniref:Zinc-finger n=1 Tax=Micromonospora echinofusca TaxID=47858 RepID=A0ABS3VJ01_MICEH|nr:hypothetical protein [Micromonospora echinofusca]MBO4204503.1 hypothetical protein [Micromonospora echinofusca]
MTAGPFGEVDFDLLADYVGGALDGTPQEAAVARLVRDDPAWAAAYDLLAPAVGGVHADLAGLGAQAEPMPAEVVDRLTAVLATAGPPTSERRSPGTGAPRPSRVPAQATGGPARPAQATPAGRPRRRWSRLVGPVAVVTAVLGLGGLGLGQLLGGDVGLTTADSSVGGAREQDPEAAGAPRPHAAGEPRAMLAPAAAQPLASGTDYTPQSLTAIRPGTDGPVAGPGPSKGAGPSTGAGPSVANSPDSVDGRTRYPVGLARLAGPAALGRCLDEIAGEHGQAAVTVTFVDYASFNGEPALVVQLTDGPGERWVWVAGPECGVPGSGADTRFRSRVG